MSLLKATALTVSAGKKTISRDLDFCLNRGESWGILGANGAGKTTLLHTLAGLRRPDRGDILVETRPLRDYPRRDLARKLGILFQDSQDTFPGTVLETVLSGRYPHLPFWGLESADDINLSREALELVSLGSMTDRQVNTLSGGERRRLSIATLLVQSPEIWLLDEPTNHLDLHQQIALIEMVSGKVRSQNGGLVMVMHDVNLVMRFCTHALLMIDADTVPTGPLAEVVTIRNLEALYRHPIRQVADGYTSLFYPL